MGATGEGCSGILRWQPTITRAGCRTEIIARGIRLITALMLLRVAVGGQPVQGGACGISGVPNSWQTLSNVCALQLPAGQHQVALQYQAQVSGSTCYIRNPTLTAIGGLSY